MITAIEYKEKGKALLRRRIQIREISPHFSTVSQFDDFVIKLRSSRKAAPFELRIENCRLII